MMSVMKLKDVAPGFPHGLSWVCSYSDLDKFTPDTTMAVILRSDVRGGGVKLTVLDGRQEFSTVLSIAEEEVRNMVHGVLLGARGTPISQAGELEISVSD